MIVEDHFICHCITLEVIGAKQSPIGMMLCIDKMGCLIFGLMGFGLGILRMELKRAIMPQS